jgi:phenylacetaldehyde dehydrogenase
VVSGILQGYFFWLQRVLHPRSYGYRPRIFEGVRAFAGGKKLGTSGYFVQPTVLVDTHPKMKVVQEEIFGPVVVATPFTDPEEVLSAANQSVYGLAAAVWTRDLPKAHMFAARVKAGTVWINCYNVFDAALPFGGYKQSG